MTPRAGWKSIRRWIVVHAGSDVSVSFSATNNMTTPIVESSTRHVTSRDMRRDAKRAP